MTLTDYCPLAFHIITTVIILVFMCEENVFIQSACCLYMRLYFLRIKITLKEDEIPSKGFSLLLPRNIMYVCI